MFLRKFLHEKTSFLISKMTVQLSNQIYLLNPDDAYFSHFIGFITSFVYRQSLHILLFRSFSQVGVFHTSYNSVRLFIVIQHLSKRKHAARYVFKHQLLQNYFLESFMRGKIFTMRSAYFQISFSFYRVFFHKSNRNLTSKAFNFKQKRTK